jgi:hypothetical protein
MEQTVHFLAKPLLAAALVVDTPLHLVLEDQAVVVVVLHQRVEQQEPQDKETMEVVVQQLPIPMWLVVAVVPVQQVATLQEIILVLVAADQYHQLQVHLFIGQVVAVAEDKAKQTEEDPTTQNQEMVV